MGNATSTPAQPLIARLRELADVERARREAADLAVTEAERVLQETQYIQRVAAERHAAVLATVEAAEAYAGQQAQGASDTVSHAEQTEQVATDRTASPSASGRSLKHLVVDALNVGEITPLTLIYERVREVRPDSTASAIRAALATLHKKETVEIVRRGAYRLLEIPEGYRTDI
ncbi:hypothetical protein OG272_20940 [Streptomyces sp. NBC_00104]|uniref:hypothetical protein n=1 Tax=Streptomyces sp. NBC_00104 TaxID=2903621 RepID=UPI00324BAB0F